MATIVNAPTQVVNPPSTSHIRVGTTPVDDARYLGAQDSWNESPAGQLGFSPNMLSSLQQEFCNSQAFRQAFELFSNCPEPQTWLARLSALVLSIVTPKGDEHFNRWDSLEGYFQGDPERASALNTAYSNLSNLVNEYSTWFNSLPATQRSQYDQAGLNIALSGGSQLSGSAVPSANIATSDVVDASNQAFDNVVNFATSTAGGLLELIGSVQNVFRLGQSGRQLDIQEDSTLSTVNQQRISLGLNPLSKLSDVGSKKTIASDELSSYAIKSANEQEAASKKSRIALETEVNPLYDAVDNAARLDVAPYNEILAKIGNIQFATKLYNEIYQNELTNFNLEQQKIKNQVLSQYGGELALGEAQTVLEEQAAKKAQFKRSAKLDELGESLVNYKKSMLSDWITKANSNSPDAFIYSSLLMKSGLNLSEFMGPAEVGIDYISKGSDILDNILGVLNPLNWIKPKK